MFIVIVVVIDTVVLVHAIISVGRSQVLCPRLPYVYHRCRHRYCYASPWYNGTVWSGGKPPSYLLTYFICLLTPSFWSDDLRYDVLLTFIIDVVVIIVVVLIYAIILPSLSSFVCWLVRSDITVTVDWAWKKNPIFFHSLFVSIPQQSPKVQPVMGEKVACETISLHLYTLPYIQV